MTRGAVFVFTGNGCAARALRLRATRPGGGVGGGTISGAGGEGGEGGARGDKGVGNVRGGKALPPRRVARGRPGPRLALCPRVGRGPRLISKFKMKQGSMMRRIYEKAATNRKTGCETTI